MGEVVIITKLKNKLFSKKVQKPFISLEDRPRTFMADGTEVKPIHGLKLKVKKSTRTAPFIGNRWRGIMYTCI